LPLRKTIVKTLYSAAATIVLMFANSTFAQTSNAPRMVDKFGNICCEDEMARLDNFANQLQNEPAAQGYIIFYEGRRYASCSNHISRIPRLGEAAARASRIKPYLTQTRGLDPGRLIIINGGFREEWTAELWAVPPGAEAPKPTPTLRAKNIRYRKGKIGRREYNCSI
jgi:hypothetical protein